MDMHTRPANAVSPATVLVVDDDQLVREPIADYLREVGYAVLEAGDAHEAINLVDHADHVDLVFTDVRMPGELDGVGLARWVKAHHPGLPVLMTSGYYGTGWLGERLEREVRLIQKPYTQDEVLRHIRRLLAAHAPTAGRSAQAMRA
ncbi:MAG TPA: response regulator [Acetobacteraceae bacterium]|jgi:CheY-like chemotaxis protein|nr:response regulator [Acetobacteraceae bacterium]